MRFTEQVSEKIKNHPGVEWVPIEELFRIQMTLQEVVRDGVRMSELRADEKKEPLPERNLCVEEREQLLIEFKRGDKLRHPVTVCYDHKSGLLRLALGNQRIEALALCGWTHVPTEVRRMCWTGTFSPRSYDFERVHAGTTDLFGDQGWVLPSQVGLHGVGVEEVP